MFVIERKKSQENGTVKVHYINHFGYLTNDMDQVKAYRSFLGARNFAARFFLSSNDIENVNYFIYNTMTDQRTAI